MAPTIQQRYWTGTINGNPQLDSYRQHRLEAGVTVQPGEGTVTLQARGYVHQHERMVVLRADSMFAGVPDVNQWGGVVEFQLESSILGGTRNRQLSSNTAVRISRWRRNCLTAAGCGSENQASVYWKGYVLDNAAYCKNGILRGFVAQLLPRCRVDFRRPTTGSRPGRQTRYPPTPDSTSILPPVSGP